MRTKVILAAIFIVVCWIVPLILALTDVVAGDGTLILFGLGAVAIVTILEWETAKESKVKSPNYLVGPVGSVEPNYYVEEKPIWP